MKIDYYSHLFDGCDISKQSEWKDVLKNILEDIFSNPSHGHFNKWLSSIDELSKLNTTHHALDKPIVEIGSPEELLSLDILQVEPLLKTLLPWRKGPFNFFGTVIDSEWRCEKKWQRVQAALPSLTNKTILDVGCGNGYYMLRMLGLGADTIIGVDPTLLFLAQYTAITQNLQNKLPAHLLPIPLEQLPSIFNQFDVVFSMGVLYHRRDPMEHLNRLYTHINEGGQLILETLIINNPKTYELIPEDRYAGMRNVWSIPSPTLLESWLKQCGFHNIRMQNIHTTDVEEQRPTEWTKNFSLENFLDPDDSNKTIEGYPSPTRAIFSAEKN